MRSIFLAGLVGLAGIATAQTSTPCGCSDSGSTPSSTSSQIPTSTSVDSSSSTSSSSSGSSSIYGSSSIDSLSSGSSPTDGSSSTQSSISLPSSSTISTTPTPTSTSYSSSVTSATSTQATAIIVAKDGSGQFTAINAAVTAAQNSGIATVSVLAGTYTEAVNIGGTQTLTIIGATPTSYSGYADNQVVITTGTTSGAIGVTDKNKGTTFKYLNLVNSLTTGTAPAVYLRGSNAAFYSCSLISGSSGTYYSSYSTALIYNSYIEGTDKLFTNYPTVYVYGSTIAPLNSNALIMYAKGATISGVNYNSTLVVDSSVVIQKSGFTNTYVYLAAPNGAYTRAIYRNSNLGSLIAPSGFYSTSCSLSAFYGEYQNTGAGAYSASNSASRTGVCDNQLTAVQASSFSIEQVFGNAYPGYGSFDTTWIDSSALSAIRSSESTQTASASSSTFASSESSSSSTGNSSSTSSTLVTGTVVSVTTLPSSSIVSTSATCAAPTPSSTLVVSLNATSCQYGNISAAVSALPNDSKPYTILIMPGTYNEQLSITRNGKVTLIGQTTYVNDYTQNAVKVQFSSGRLTNLGQNEQTPIINAKKANDNSGLAVYNIDFVNTYPQTYNTAALAADFYGANIAAYGCSFIGFQDTLLANKGTQVFSNCYIEGSVDFIWGFSTAFFHQCYIATNTPNTCIAAQSRPAGTISGYVFDSCYVTFTSAYGSAPGLSYLGRPYNQYSTAIYMNSFLDKHINAAGWQVWSTSNPQTSNVTFGEFNNTGAGSWQSGTARASFATNLTADQAQAYSLGNWIGDTSWIDMTAYKYAPSFTITGSSTSASASASASATTSGPTSTATINAHPDSGTIPPRYAVLVSPNGAINGSYPNVTAALASLPSDSTNQTVFIYAGTYTEQVPTISRPGAVRIIAYTTGNAGQSYKDNQVTITFARGLSVSPLPAGHSDAETATIQTSSNKISFYNINIVNSDNLDGTEASYVTLASSIYGNDIGFYACSFQGWQDTLLTGATAGYQYYESCYIGGAIDFIWGYSKAYFKGCTIGAKKAKSAVTAHSRASSTAIGGYIFDQCLFTSAPDATVDLTNTVYLGRPYSAYALVVIKNSYIDNVINPSGWKIWSVTDPRTDHITFAEYNNQGPSNWENNAAARLAFGNATLLTSDSYPLSSVMDSTSWIDMTYWNSIVTPQPTVANTTTPPVVVSGSSTYNGTIPPAGALIVSKSAIAGLTTYNSIQAALNAAPTTSKTNATIFIYPGVYEEQLIVNKSGTTIFMGYSSSTDDFNANQVTIQQSYGEDTQGTGSDVDAATVYATGNYFYAYNINFRNNNGTQQNIASLGFAVKSSKYAFMHGCQIYGNQDTLYISGSLFTFKSYIEGNVDFIFGAGSGYFLDTTISPNEDGVAITAAKRTTNTTQAGFVFDQCTLKPAAGHSGFTNVSLGRPWNNNARVVYVDSYLDSMIGSAGWTQWSKSAPQTDGVTFGEYHNYGPGSSTCGRASFSKQLSDTEIAAYQLSNFFVSTSWIDFSVVDTQPFTVGIGSAPSCSTFTSSASLSTISATTISTSSSSTTSSSSLPLVTAYVTKTTIDKETLYTTIQIPDSTSTVMSVVTESDFATVTPAPVYKTSTLKATTTLYSTVTAAANTVTVKSTETEFQTTTVQGKDTTVKSTSITTLTTSLAGKTVIVKATSTVSVEVMSTPKATTTTLSLGGTQTVYSTLTPKGATITSVSTVSVAGSTKTSTAKASTVVSLTTVLKTTTKKTTVTQTCVPTAGAARMFRFKRELEARDAGTTTITTFTTVTSFVKTSTASLPGAVYSTTVVSTVTKDGVTTLKPATSTIYTTNYKTVDVVATETFAAATTTLLAYTTSTATVTAPGSTVIILASSTTYITHSGAVATSTSYATVTNTLILTAAAPTITITKSADVATTVKTTLAASTATVYKTSTVSGSATTILVTPGPVTKTSSVKATSTVFSTATKTAKNAPACTN